MCIVKRIIEIHGKIMKMQKKYISIYGMTIENMGNASKHQVIIYG